MELHMDGAPLGHIILDASELEGLIWQLAGHRENMAEAVTPSLDASSRLVALVNPVWQTAKRHPPEGKALALRHPGFGWLSFVFPRAEAEAIAAEFMKPSVEAD